MIAVFGVDQLRRDSNLAACLLHAALENTADIELLTNIAEVGIFTFECKRRGATGDLEFANLCQCMQQVFSQAVREIFLVLIRTHVDKRQHSN